MVWGLTDDTPLLWFGVEDGVQEVRQLLREPRWRVVVCSADLAEERPKVWLVKWQRTRRDHIQAHTCTGPPV